MWFQYEFLLQASTSSRQGVTAGSAVTGLSLHSPQPPPVKNRSISNSPKVEQSSPASNLNIVKAKERNVWVHIALINLLFYLNKCLYFRMFHQINGPNLWNHLLLTFRAQDLSQQISTCNELLKLWYLIHKFSIRCHYVLHQLVRLAHLYL